MIKDKNLPSRTRKSPPLLTSDEQPLLRLLVAEATRRGDTLAELAKVLGVTYERLAQWRRDAAQISKATRSAHQKAASYLGLPTVLILVLSGMTELSDFVWPQRESLRTRLGREIERMRQDPYLGAFVPKELATAEPAIKLFVTFMFHELESGPRHAQSAYQWLSALHLASTGNRDSQLELQKLREAAPGSLRVFTFQARHRLAPPFMEALFLWPKVLDSVISTVRNLKNHLKTKKIYTLSWVTTHDSTN